MAMVRADAVLLDVVNGLSRGEQASLVQFRIGRNGRLAGCGL